MSFKTVTPTSRVIPSCYGSPSPTCKVRHVGKKCPFVGYDRWLDRDGNTYHSPGGSGHVTTAAAMAAMVGTVVIMTVMVQTQVVVATTILLAVP